MDPRLEAELELAAVPPDELARRLYRMALRRDPEPEAAERAVRRLADGTLSRAALLHELVTSAEFERVRALDDAIAFAAWARGANERPRGLTAPAACDERAIEIPWTLARYRREPRVLDIGSAHAEPAYLAALAAAAPGQVTGLDLAAVVVPGFDGIAGDLRKLPFADASFDVVFCISTLEHVGYDNTRYGIEGERDAGGIERALAELRRVLADAGRLLVTVPCGPEEDLGWYVRLPAERWRQLFDEARLSVVEDEVYGLGDAGWAAGGTDGCLCAELVRAGLRARVRRRLQR